MAAAKPAAVGPRDGVAWVTGASSGIGHALALRLARDGWTVAASARRREALERLAETAAKTGGTVLVHACDVTDLEQVRTIVAAITAERPIALAVLNAGAYTPDTFEDFDLDAVRKTVDLNVMGTVQCLEALRPHWVERKRGHLAVVASVAGYRGLPRALSYSATKAALISLCETLKFDFDRLGLKVQVINPGFVKTPATDQNDFKMPFLIPADQAADEIVAGLRRDSFEIAFPKPFAFIMKRLRNLPNSLYFPAVRKTTGL